MADELSVLKINPHVFTPFGSLKPFSQQYGEYSIVKESYDDARRRGANVAPPNRGPMTEYTPFVLSLSCVSFGLSEIASKPLIISKAAFDHIRYDHQNDIDKLMKHLDNLANELANNLLAFQSKRTPAHLTFVLESRTRSEHPVNVIVSVNVNVNTIDVASDRTMYGNSHLVSDMNETLELNRQFYVSTRTGAWVEDITASGQLDPSGDLGRHLISLYCTQFPHAHVAERLMSLVGPSQGRGPRNPSLARSIRIEGTACQMLGHGGEHDHDGSR